MSTDAKLQNAGNPYDPDDPVNYMTQDAKGGGSSIIPWMFFGMFVVAVVIGLFFGQGSPLSYNLVTHLSDLKPTPAKTLSN